MVKVSNFTSHTLDHEPDTIAIPRLEPGNIIIGTYHLNEQEDGNSSASRVGSLQVLRTDSTTSKIEVSSRLDFRFGIYDIRFHPVHKNLLGVATSHAEILLFWCRHRDDSVNIPPPSEIVALGRLYVEGTSENQFPIITQFNFIHNVSKLNTAIDGDSNNFVRLVATTQLGNTKLIQFSIPDDQHQTENSPNIREIASVVTQVHKQAMDLEAWTVATIPLVDEAFLVVSGGDDSRMVASICDTSEDQTSVIQSFVDSRTHAAGVVSLLHIDTFHESIPEEDGLKRILLLSGSYDEVLRLFFIDFTSKTVKKPVLATELKLPGGVWRLELLDCYSIPLERQCGDGVSTNETRNYILLVSAHLGGAFIVRLEIAGQQDRISSRFTIEAEFTIGHESLVYACAATCTGKTENGGNGYTVFSTSFYDKKICQWKWVDERAP